MYNPFRLSAPGQPPHALFPVISQTERGRIQLEQGEASLACIRVQGVSIGAESAGLGLASLLGGGWLTATDRRVAIAMDEAQISDRYWGKGTPVGSARAVLKNARNRRHDAAVVGDQVLAAHIRYEWIGRLQCTGGKKGKSKVLTIMFHENISNAAAQREWLALTLDLDAQDVIPFARQLQKAIIGYRLVGNWCLDSSDRATLEALALAGVSDSEPVVEELPGAIAATP